MNRYGYWNGFPIPAPPSKAEAEGGYCGSCGERGAEESGHMTCCGEPAVGPHVAVLKTGGGR